jgi:hypothetical protein
MRWLPCTTTRCGGVLTLAALLGCASPARAQTVDRSYRGLFGAAAAGADRDRAALQVTIAEALDQDVSTGGAVPIPTAPQTNRLFTRLTAELSVRAGSDVQVAATAGGSFRYYPELDQVTRVGHHAGIGVSTDSTRTTSLAFNQTVAYSPSYLYRLFATAAAPEPGQATVESNYFVYDSPSYSYNTSIGVTQRMGRRNRLSVTLGGRYTDYVRGSAVASAAEPLRDLMSYEAGATFTRDVNLSQLNVGYVFKRAEYFGALATEHDINIGFDYDRPLSRTRRTHLRFKVGSIMLKTDAPALPGELGRQRPQIQFAGDMSISRQFRRTWQATGAYVRSIGFIEGLSRPVLTDAATFNATGLVSPRVDLALTGAYSVGQPTSGSASRSFTSYTGNLRARVALTSLLAVYSEYLYYFYDFTGSLLLPPGVPPKMSRNSAHLGLTLHIPMGRR